MKRSTHSRILIILMDNFPDENSAQVTRAACLHNEISRHFPDTYLMMKEGDNPSVREGQILIRPWIPVQGRFQLLKGIIFRVQMTASIIRFVHQKRITSAIIREFDTAPLFPFLKLQKVKIFYDFHGRHDLELNPD